jgi:hypothetical protein
LAYAELRSAQKQTLQFGAFPIRLAHGADDVASIGPSRFRKVSMLGPSLWGAAPEPIIARNPFIYTC